ncbi:hypothetical protein GCM10020219_028890 [Nonomuraea dietziae]
MLELACENAARAGVSNVEFLHGRIEAVPLPGHCVDAVISNCVINLSDDKPAVLAEAFRVLRPGGRFGVSDVVTDGPVDPVRRAAAEQRVGCVAGSLTVEEYRALLGQAGFVGIVITFTADHGDGVRSAIVQAHKPAIVPGLEIRPMREADAGQVLSIYQAGLDTAQAGFETVAPSWEGFTAGRLPHLRYVAVDTETDEVVGWVAASAVSARAGLRGRGRAQRLRPPGLPGPRHRPRPAHRVHRRQRGRRDLDHSVRRLPREHRQPDAAHRRWASASWARASGSDAHYGAWARRPLTAGTATQHADRPLHAEAHTTANGRAAARRSPNAA